MLLLDLLVSRQFDEIFEKDDGVIVDKKEFVVLEYALEESIPLLELIFEEALSVVFDDVQEGGKPILLCLTELI